MRRTPFGEPGDLGGPAHERAMLLELATDLQRWPARNAVFREALDRVAKDVAQMASRADGG